MLMMVMMIYDDITIIILYIITYAAAHRGVAAGRIWCV